MSKVVGREEFRNGTWAKKRASAVIRAFTYHLCAEMQRPKSQGGRMPVDAGNLRNSFTMVITNKGLKFAGSEAYARAVKSIDVGDKITAGWTQFCATLREYGDNEGYPAHLYMNSALANAQQHLIKAMSEVLAGDKRWFF